ncbi:MAG: tRNA (guanosine(37)-N1)-methyltransferase TrmD [Deltaproteobacteria bacterium]|nr:tRNA (guanosine(37)-N1)-methyltransferase TrmD [Deltaproteobacteria bacterium]
MRFDILTIFPGLFSSFLSHGILGRSIERGLIDIRLVNIRDFTDDPHRSTDDKPYGGGAGMVMTPGPVFRALDAVKRESENSSVILLSPQGKRFDQSLAWKLAGFDQLILICGRYEGVDERIRLGYADMEISIGDYILNGGETGAMVIIEAVSRLVPGVLGTDKSSKEDTFENGLLKYPQYTRPKVFNGMHVPDVLLSGDHERIRIWRRTESIKKTCRNRPDLIKKADLTKEDLLILKRQKDLASVLDADKND